MDLNVSNSNSFAVGQEDDPFVRTLPWPIRVNCPLGYELITGR